MSIPEMISRIKQGELVKTENGISWYMVDWYPGLVGIQVTEEHCHI